MPEASTGEWRRRRSDGVGGKHPKRAGRQSSQNAQNTEQLLILVPVLWCFGRFVNSPFRVSSGLSAYAVAPSPVEASGSAHLSSIASAPGEELRGGGWTLGTPCIWDTLDTRQTDRPLPPPSLRLREWTLKDTLSILLRP